MADLVTYPPIGFEKLNVTTGAGGTALTAASYTFRDTSGTSRNRPKFAQHALLTVETFPLRFTTDGTAPDATTGHLAPVGSSIALEGYDAIKGFKGIGVGGTAVLQATYSGV